MLVNNFLAPIQVLLFPNFVSYTLATGDEVIKFWKVKGQSWWGKYALYWTPFWFNSEMFFVCRTFSM